MTNTLPTDLAALADCPTVRVSPVIVSDWPNAHQVWLDRGVMSFRVGECLETRQEAEDYASLLRRALASRAGGGWLPIESAPRDGTYVQLGNENCVWIGCYIDKYTSGFVPPVKWHSRMLNHDHVPREHRYKPPTHWQPLPPPPAKAAPLPPAPGVG